MAVRRRGPVALVLLGGAMVGCSAAAPAGSLQEGGTMQLTSDAFADAATIPPEHTCDGADTSPPLSWSDVPGGTMAFALLVEDPDAGDFVHWVLSDIPGDRRELAAGEGDDVGVPGLNDFRRTGWGGPCPPSGEHRYVFTLFALDERLDLGDGATADGVRGAIADRTLGQAQLTGVYMRR